MSKAINPKAIKTLLASSNRTKMNSDKVAPTLCGLPQAAIASGTTVMHMNRNVPNAAVTNQVGIMRLR